MLRSFVRLFVYVNSSSSRETETRGGDKVLSKPFIGRLFVFCLILFHLLHKSVRRKKCIWSDFMQITITPNRYATHADNELLCIAWLWLFGNRWHIERWKTGGHFNVKARRNWKVLWRCCGTGNDDWDVQFRSEKFQKCISGAIWEIRSLSITLKEKLWHFINLSEWVKGQQDFS